MAQLVREYYVERYITTSGIERTIHQSDIYPIQPREIVWNFK